MNNQTRVILEDVDRYRVTDAMFESVRVVLNHRGETYTPAYVQGIAGSAFRIGGICPCAPTSYHAMSVPDLLKLFSYDIEDLPLYTSEAKVDAKAYAKDKLPDVLPHIKAEIRAGYPVIVWNAFTTCEWDVVCGFDETEHKLYGRGSYAGLEEDYAVAEETRPAGCTDICPTFGTILVGEKTGTFDAQAAELAALQEAVNHAHTRKDAELQNSEDWVFLQGLQCYERWIRDWRSPEKKREMGDAYCLGVYRSTHRAAADFLREIAPKYPEATSHFEQAAVHFTVEADALDACVPLIWWEASEGPDPDRNAKTVPLLQKARDAYARAIDEIETALRLVSLE